MNQGDRSLICPPKMRIEKRKSAASVSSCLDGGGKRKNSHKIWFFAHLIVSLQQKRINNDDYGSKNDTITRRRSAIGKHQRPVDAERHQEKPRLYDPETGESLNDKTMQAIEDVRSGKDKGTTYESFEDFKKAMMAL